MKKQIKQEDFHWFVEKLKEEYPCVMKKRKCKKTNLDGSKRLVICTNCSFKFKIDKLVKELKEKGK